MEKITFKIEGMTCASCAAVIEHDLKKAKGVASASVNYATEKAYVEFNPAEIKVADIKKNITDKIKVILVKTAKAIKMPISSGLFL